MTANGIQIQIQHLLQLLLQHLLPPLTNAQSLTDQQPTGAKMPQKTALQDQRQISPAMMQAKSAAITTAWARLVKRLPLQIHVPLRMDQANSGATLPVAALQDSQELTTPATTIKSAANTNAWVSYAMRHPPHHHAQLLRDRCPTGAKILPAASRDSQTPATPATTIKSAANTTA